MEESLNTVKNQIKLARIANGVTEKGGLRHTAFKYTEDDEVNEVIRQKKKKREIMFNKEMNQLNSDIIFERKLLQMSYTFKKDSAPHSNARLLPI